MLPAYEKNYGLDTAPAADDKALFGLFPSSFDGDEITALAADQPHAMLARTLDPIPTPDGRWLRIYAMADGSVHQRSTENADEAFGDGWKLEQVKGTE